MKNTKIVKRIAALSLVGTTMLTMISCSKQGVKDNEIETSQTQHEIIVDINGNEIVEDKNILIDDSIKQNQETEKKEDEKMSVSVYNPLNFKTVADVEATYDELIAKREDYYQQMKHVLNFKLLYSEEEIAAAIYNVVRIDSDLSNLLIKINAKKQQEIQDMVYLADQIETLEKVLNDMTDLKQKIEESKAKYAPSLKDISKADAEQIEKVHKYALNPINAPITKLTKQITDLKVELEEALANQP